MLYRSRLMPKRAGIACNIQNPNFKDQIRGKNSKQATTGILVNEIFFIEQRRQASFWLL